jgi:hypothetical protein
MISFQSDIPAEGHLELSAFPAAFRRQWPVFKPTLPSPLRQRGLRLISTSFPVGLLASEKNHLLLLFLLYAPIFNPYRKII